MIFNDLGGMSETFAHFIDNDHSYVGKIYEIETVEVVHNQFTNWTPSNKQVELIKSVLNFYKSTS